MKNNANRTTRYMPPSGWISVRSEEHTSELQSQSNLVCRLLLEKKKKSHRMSNDQLVISPSSFPNRAASNSRGHRALRIAPDVQHHSAPFRAPVYAGVRVGARVR